MGDTRELYAELGDNNRLLITKGDTKTGKIALRYSDHGTFVVRQDDKVSIVLTPKYPFLPPSVPTVKVTDYNELTYTIGPFTEVGPYYMDIKINHASGEILLANDSSVVEIHVVE